MCENYQKNAFEIFSSLFIIAMHNIAVSFYRESTKNSLIRTYPLIGPLISRCENLKVLSENSSHDVIMHNITVHFYAESTINSLIST